MSASVANQAAGPHLLCQEESKKRMAKADVPSVSIREKQAEYGAILRRASQIAGLNRDETAQALKVDPGQLGRWWSGAENPQMWRYHANRQLRGALLIALAEAHDGAEVETTVRIKRTAA